MKRYLTTLLEKAGITINGKQPHDIQIHDERLFRSFLFNPSLAAGEGYMEGWWSSERLDEVIFRMTRYGSTDSVYQHWLLRATALISGLFNEQTRKRALNVAELHYNLDNELYRCMLGETMAYTCAYWANATSLDQAQYNKFDLVCKKIQLKKGERILDLGCGWGGFSKYASTHYGCEVVAVNIASEQVSYGKEQCKGLPVQFYLCDWRDPQVYNPTGKKFDKVVSIGLAEHVGYKNYRQFMQISRANLKEDGLFLLHTIGHNESSTTTDPWIKKYIFPNGMLPSLKQLAGSMESLFVVEDLHNIGTDYDKTLLAWKQNFDQHWPELSKRFDERFRRMWDYYLLGCAALFRARKTQLWQFVLSPQGVLNGYQSCPRVCK